MSCARILQASNYAGTQIYLCCTETKMPRGLETGNVNSSSDTSGIGLQNLPNFKVNLVL